MSDRRIAGLLAANHMSVTPVLASRVDKDDICDVQTTLGNTQSPKPIYIIISMASALMLTLVKAQLARQ